MKSIFISLVGLFLGVYLTPAAAGQTVTPRVCVDSSYETGSTTLAANAAVGQKTISVNSAVPSFVALVINPGAANEEQVSYVGTVITGTNPYTLTLNPTLHYALNPNGFNYSLAFAHTAGETVTFQGYHSTAYFGYQNSGNTTVNIPRGVSSHNFFSPGPLVYAAQPNQFLPGTHNDVFSITFGGLVTDSLSWFLNDNEMKAVNGLSQACAKTTYQGRLSEANAAANGQYDLQFTLFDSLTGGAEQNAGQVIENVPVTNGVFTVVLNFGSTFINNNRALFLEIAVRPGSASGSDPFTTLAPRQPLTAAPYAITSQTAFVANRALTADAATIATTATNVEGDGNTRIPRTSGPPSSDDCFITVYGTAHPQHIGRMSFDVTNNRLYICASSGWKFVPLQ